MNFEERIIIQVRLKDVFSPYKIAKELKRSINTFLNEIRRSTTTQIKQGKQIEMYLADTGDAIYKKHRLNPCRAFKRLDCCDFINYVVDKIKNSSWSPDACVGNSLETNLFKRSDTINNHNGLIRRFIPKGKRMSDYSAAETRTALKQ